MIFTNNAIDCVPPFAVCIFVSVFIFTYLCSFDSNNMLWCALAIGCADPPAVVNAWSARVGDTLTVRCNFSRDMYELKCDDSGRWIGDRLNCSAGARSNRLFRHIAYAIREKSPLVTPFVKMLVLGKEFN